MTDIFSQFADVARNAIPAGWVSSGNINLLTGQRQAVWNNA